MQHSELRGRLDAAFDKRKRGDYIGALESFKRLEAHYSHQRDLTALAFYQATCLTDLGRPLEALDKMSRIEKGDLTPFRQLDYDYETARIERGLGHAREALDLAKNAYCAAMESSSIEGVSIIIKEALTLTGILHAEVGNYDEAIPILEAVSLDDEGWAEATLKLGDCKIGKRMYQKAITCYQRLLGDPKAVDPIVRVTAVRNIGCAYYYIGDYPNAIEYLARVVGDYNDTPSIKAELFEMLGASYSRLGRKKEAAKYSGLSKGTGSIQ